MTYINIIILEDININDFFMELLKIHINNF